MGYKPVTNNPSLQARGSTQFFGHFFTIKKVTARPAQGQ